MTTLNILGQINCPSTSAPTQGPDVSINQMGRYLQGLPANTGYVYVGETSDMTTTDSYPLSAAQQVYVSSLLITNLSDLWFLPTVANEGVAWFTG